jgi:hypothetical protein
MALQTVAQPAKNAPRDRWDDKDLIPVEIPRDRWDRPLIVPPGGGEPVGYTRASSLGSQLEYMGNLHKRDLRYVFVNATKSPDLVLCGQSVQDPDDKAARKDLDGWVRIALEPARAKARIGTALHRLTEQVDQTGAIPPVGEHVPALAAYQRVMSAWFEILHSEAFLVNDELEAAGTTDRIVRLKAWMQPVDKQGNAVGEPLPPGTVLAFDLKTSGTADYFGAKFCAQLKVYQGGQLYDLRTGQRSSPGDLHGRWALILHMPAGGATAELFWVDLAVGAYAADLAREVKAADKAGKAAISRAVIEPWVDTAVEDAAQVDPAPAVATSPTPVLAAAADSFAGQVFAHVKAYTDAQRLLDAVRRVGEDVGASEQTLLDLYRTNARIWRDEHTVAAGEASAAIAARVAAGSRAVAS